MSSDKSDWMAITFLESLLKNKINEHIIDISKATESLFNNLKKNIIYANKTLEYLLISPSTIPVPFTTDNNGSSAT